MMNQRINITVIATVIFLKNFIFFSPLLFSIYIINDFFDFVKYFFNCQRNKYLYPLPEFNLSASWRTTLIPLTIILYHVFKRLSRGNVLSAPTNISAMVTVTCFSKSPRRFLLNGRHLPLTIIYYHTF